MMEKVDQGIEAGHFANAVDFFDQMADEDLTVFLRSLPVIATNQDEPFTIADLTYEILLQPYVLHAWKTVGGKPGVVGRILQLSNIYETAEAALERETGRKRRVPRVISFPAFMDAYLARGLPLSVSP